MKTKTLLLTAALGLTSVLALGQVVNDLNVINSFNFTGFDGNSVPSGWTSTSSAFRGYSTGTNQSGGIVSFGVDGTGANTDRWFGFQFAGTPNDVVTNSLTLTNNTGVSITSLVISYQAYQFRAANGGRSSFFDVNLNGGSPIVDLNFTSDNTLATGERGTILGVSAFPTTLTTTITGLNIADQSSFTINWVGNRGTVTGSAQGIGINNIAITAIHEPGTLALVGLMGLAAVVGLRRRK